MDADTFADRWQRNPSEVLKNLCKKHEGELVELEGWWHIGDEEYPPDELFDPQLASNEADFRRQHGSQQVFCGLPQGQEQGQGQASRQGGQRASRW